MNSENDLSAPAADPGGVLVQDVPDGDVKEKGVLEGEAFSEVEELILGSTGWDRRIGISVMLPSLAILASGVAQEQPPRCLDASRGQISVSTAEVDSVTANVADNFSGNREYQFYLPAGHLAAKCGGCTFPTQQHMCSI